MPNHLLTIGLNYTGSQNQLAGCLNDARDWHARFSPLCASSTQLLEQQANKAGMVSAIAEVLRKVGIGDWAIITYSGHGTYIPDQSGDEADRRDEALCPFDLNKNLLLDDELRDLLTYRPPGSRVLLITDCCHSGTMARGLDERGSPRYVPFSDLTCCMCTEAVDRITTQAKTGRSRARSVDTGLVHLSGCQDDQVSYDATIGGRACGAFTYYALAALKARTTPGLTFGEWRDLVRPYLPSSRYPQSPGFSGDLAAVVPGFEAAAVAPPLPAQTTFEGVTSDGRKIRGTIG